MAKTDLSKIETLIERLANHYEKNPTIRALVSLLSITSLGALSAIDAALMTKIQNIREERARTFFDELAKCNIELTPELMDSEDFLHCYFATVKATLNTRRRDKIKMFARLLKASTLPESFSDIDEYEEYLQALDGLGNIHIIILSILAEKETTVSKIGTTGAKIMRTISKVALEEREVLYETEGSYRVSAALEKLSNIKFITQTHRDADVLISRNINVSRGYIITPLGKKFVHFVLQP